MIDKDQDYYLCCLACSHYSCTAKTWQANQGRERGKLERITHKCLGLHGENSMAMKSNHKIVEMKDETRLICPVCGQSGCVAGRTVEFREAPIAPVCRCDTCGYRWLPRNKNSTADVTRDMISRCDSTSSAWMVSRLPADFRERQDARVLDIGCWDGTLLGDLPDSWRRVGIEPNPRAAELAQSKGVTVVQEPVEDVSMPGEQFDLILMLDVLEHLYKPMDALRKVSHWLAPGGCLFAVTGSASGLAPRLFGGKWYYLNYPEHVGCFTQESIRYALKNVHLELESIGAEAHQTATFGATLRKVRARISGGGNISGDAGLGAPTHWTEALVLALSRILRKKDHMVVLARKPEH